MNQQTNENTPTFCRYQELNPEMDAFLTEYLEYGRLRGLQESSIHLHDKIGHYFLSNVEETGCTKPQEMNARNVGAACLAISSKWYLAKVKDVNFHAGTILIRHAKNNKQRVVPMNSTLTEMLERYCIAMGIKSDPESHLFPASRNEGAAVNKGTFELLFRKLLRETDLYVPGKAHSRGRCLHCFRHYFAIHSFAQAERNGRPTDDSVPFLSVYLGHHDMDETEKYLKFSSDMFPEYMGLFEDYATGVFTEVTYEEK